jgi:hypothetical protein
MLNRNAKKVLLNCRSLSLDHILYETSKQDTLFQGRRAA